MTFRAFLALILAVAGVGAFAADGVWVIREDGVGPAKIGMTLSQLSTSDPLRSCPLR